MTKNLPYLFAKKDVIDQFADDKQFENHMASQVRSGKIVNPDRVRGKSSEVCP